MPEFLSVEWVASLDRAARASVRLAECARGQSLVLEQRVMFPDGSEHAHHLVLTDGCPRVRNGRADDPDVVLFTDLATARDLALGRTNAQRALTAGRLRVHGDVHSLLAHSEQLAALDDVFAQARSEASSSPADGNLGSTIESGESKT